MSTLSLLCSVFSHISAPRWYHTGPHAPAEARGPHHSAGRKNPSLTRKKGPTRRTREYFIELVREKYRESARQSCPDSTETLTEPTVRCVIYIYSFPTTTSRTQETLITPVQFSSLSRPAGRGTNAYIGRRRQHMARGKAAPSGIRVSGADSSRVLWSFQPPRARRPNSWYSPAFK